MSVADGREVEVKLRVGAAEDARGRILAAGFTVLHSRVFEGNDILDTPEGTLRARGEVLRLRQVGDRTVVTWKGPADRASVHKSREERETAVASAEEMATLLARLGYAVVFRYEKFRTEFTDGGGQGVVTLDETPVGTFLELEGEPGWIDATAALLGFTPADYVTASYGQLYLEHCQDSGVVPTHMVFPQRTPLEGTEKT